MFAQMWLCMHEWCQSWLMTSCFQPIAMIFGMWVYNDCANIYISKKNLNVCTNVILHAWMMSIMSDDIMFSTIVMKFGMLVYIDCANIY